jgi:hypothetical protein
MENSLVSSGTELEPQFRDTHFVLVENVKTKTISAVLDFQLSIRFGSRRVPSWEYVPEALERDRVSTR